MNVICTARENDLEVSDLIGAVDVLLDVVAVRSRMRMRQIGVKPLLNANVTTASPLWQRTSFRLNAAAYLHHHAGNANASENETVEIVITSDHREPAAMMIVIMIASVEIARRNVKGCTAAGLTEVRMTSFLMEMNARQVPDDAVRMTKMTIQEGIHEIPRLEEPVNLKLVL